MYSWLGTFRFTCSNSVIVDTSTTVRVAIMKVAGCPLVSECEKKAWVHRLFRKMQIKRLVDLRLMVFLLSCLLCGLYGMHVFVWFQCSCKSILGSWSFATVGGRTPVSYILIKYSTVCIVSDHCFAPVLTSQRSKPVLGRLEGRPVTIS